MHASRWLFALLLSGAGNVLLAQMNWTSVAASPLPMGRGDHGLVYDGCRQRLVVFGGLLSGAVQTGDTWEWTGTVWQQVATGGPAARSNFAMAYDEQRCRIVLHGGWNQAQSGGGFTALFGDTWEWDGVSWAQVTTLGPAARQGHVMAYDPLRGKVVLFGGQAMSGAMQSDVWEWDGASWQMVVSSSPTSERMHATLTFQPILGELVLVGGDGNPGAFSDIWSWNGARWDFVGIGPAISKHGAAWHSARRRMILRGGWNTVGPSPHTYEWDGQSWLLQHTQPTSYAGLKLVFDTARGDIVQFGGVAIGVGFSDLFAAFTATIPATVQSAGGGCGGNPTPNLTAPLLPLVGSAGFELQLQSNSVLSPVILAMAPQPGQNQVFGSCIVVPDLTLTVLQASVVGFQGIAQLPFPIPANPAISGLDLYAHAAVLDGTGPMLGIMSLSNALRITIGD